MSPLTFAITDKGHRKNNEDFVAYFEPTDSLELTESGCVYIVADGVGGATRGARASQYASQKVLYEYFQHPEIHPVTRLKQAIIQANKEIFDYSVKNSTRMATTLTVAIIINNTLIVANVGDSRAYLIRGNEVHQISQDHSLLGELVRDGVMSESEAMKSKDKNRITRSVGGEENVLVDIFGPSPLNPEDKILLCSDGLTRYATKKDIAHICKTGSPEQISNNLISFTKLRGQGKADNISVVFCDLSQNATAKVLPRPDEFWDVFVVSPLEDEELEGLQIAEEDFLDAQKRTLPVPILLLPIKLIRHLLSIFK